MGDGHLYLSNNSVSYSGGNDRAWYDATHTSVLLLSSYFLYLLPLDALLDPALAAAALPEKRMTLYDFRETEASGGYQEAVWKRNVAWIMLLQLSPNGHLLAIQRSDIEVQVLHRATRASYWVLCRSKAGNRILHGGVIWNRRSTNSSSSQDLFLVTKLGIEHYRVSFSRRNCVLHRGMGLYVREFWYAASNGVLFLSTGSRANEIMPLLLHEADIETLPKLVFSSSVGKNDLHLVTLYGDVYAIYSDARSAKLLLYLVGRTEVTCVRSLNLMLPLGKALEYSVVDNLLVCHSLDFNVSLFFDIKCDGSVSDPFSAPLPISLWPPSCPRFERKTALANSIVDIHKEAAVASEVVRDEYDQEISYAAILLSPEPSRSTCYTFSAGDQDSQSRNIDDTRLSSPSRKPFPASQLASQKPARRLQRAVSEASVKKTIATKRQAVAPSVSRWQFYAPNFVQRSFVENGLKKVVIGKLQLNLAEVCKSCESHREILPFLLRREDYITAKVLVLQLVRNSIVEQQLPLSSIVHLLSTAQTLYGSQQRDAHVVDGEALVNLNLMHSNSNRNLSELPKEHNPRLIPTARNAKGFMLIQQADFYHHVWKNILEDKDISMNNNLSVFIVEYIKMLQERQVQVENITYIALAECFLATGHSNELYQFLHYHVLPDSVELAELMVQNGKIYPELMQVGLDMYVRLTEICPLIHTLLDLGQAEQAIEIAWKNMTLISCDTSVLPGVAFFDSLVKSVTSSKQPRSSFQVTKMLVHLLHFLKVWDPASLKRSSKVSVSALASHATVPFPDAMLPQNTRIQLKRAFGFT